MNIRAQNCSGELFQTLHFLKMSSAVRVRFPQPRYSCLVKTSFNSFPSSLEGHRFDNQFFTLKIFQLKWHSDISPIWFLGTRHFDYSLINFLNEAHVFKGMFS